jgi:hypothetical protein
MFYTPTAGPACVFVNVVSSLLSHPCKIILCTTAPLHVPFLKHIKEAYKGLAYSRVQSHPMPQDETAVNLRREHESALQLGPRKKPYATISG